MANYVLIHGADSDSRYWHRVIPELEARGHHAIAPDLPCDDDTAGLSDCADAVADAIGDRMELVVVAQSLAGLTAPLVAARKPVDLLVMLAAMIPRPGEMGRDWRRNTCHAQARREQNVRDGRDPDAPFDPVVTFLHDLPPEVLATRSRICRAASPTAAVPGSVAAGVLAPSAAALPAGSPRSLLPGPVPAPRREGAPRHHARRDGRRLIFPRLRDR